MDGMRSSRRNAVSLTCPCRLSDGITLDLELLDVSPRGCRVRIAALPLHFGQSLTMFPEGIDEFTGTVRQAGNEFAGIEFDRELPHPVFERMRSHIPATDQEPVAASPAGPTAPENAVQTTSERAGFSSLANVAVTRRGRKTFGNRAVLLP